MPDTLLTGIYLALSLFGAGQAVWLNAVIAKDRYLTSEPPLLRQARRIAIAAFALGLLWSAKYCVEQRWSPWPPDLLVVGAVDLYLAVAAISSHTLRRRHRHG